MFDGREKKRRKGVGLRLCDYKGDVTLSASSFHHIWYLLLNFTRMPRNPTKLIYLLRQFKQRIITKIRSSFVGLLNADLYLPLASLRLLILGLHPTPLRLFAQVE